MSAVLTARGIVKSYDRRVVLDGIDVSVGHGCTVGVVGESGSGKTTLGRVLMRLAAPDSGRVEVEGHDFLAARGSELRAIRRRIQLVPQDPRNSLNPTMTVRQNLAFQLRAHRLNWSSWRQASIRVLALVGLGADVMHAFPHELSGGQAQRVAIARALITDPAVLVCDEAVSALDKSVQAHVLNTLSRLQAETGVSLLFISHDLAVIEHLADEIVVLDGGNVVEHGPTAEVIGSPRDAYTRKLLSARLTVPQRSQKPHPPSPQHHH